MGDKDYAIVPEKEFIQMKSDVDKIKRNPFQAYATEDLVESINNLTKAIGAMLDLFKTAAEEMKIEEREAETVGKKMDPMFSKIDMILDQNQKIARGIVAVADMMETQKPGAWRKEAEPAPISAPQNNQPMMQPRPQMMAGPSGPMAPQRTPGMAPPSGPRMPLGPMGPPQGGMRPPAQGAPTGTPSGGMPMPPPPQLRKKGLFG